MNKKQLTLSLITLVLAATSSHAWAGEKGGNGGGAWVCYDGDGNIRSAELLDLAEATRPPLNLSVPTSDEPKQAQLEHALERLNAFDPETALAMRKILALLELPGHRVHVTDGYELVPPTDTHLKVLRKERGCSLRGLGDFDDDTRILTYDPEILGAMSPTHQAAFDFHEAYYRVQRLGLARAENSSFSRKMTGAIFSTDGPRITPPTQGLERARYVCNDSGKYQFYILPNGDGLSGRIQFTMIDSRWVTDLTYGDYDIRRYHDPILEMLGRKISQGLLYSEVQIQKSRSWFNQWVTGRNDGRDDWYTGVFTTVSEFEPPYSLVLTAIDEINYHSGRMNPKTETISVFARPWFHANDAVSMRMSWEKESAEGLLDCQAL